MARPWHTVAYSSPRFPHPRGDGPPVACIWGLLMAISPPAWGWPAACAMSRNGKPDFPTRVGMARRDDLRIHARPGFPHPRGDGPECHQLKSEAAKISPPAWGWPEGRLRALHTIPDFPTRVGMARRRQALQSPRHRFPHPRGDGPVPVPKSMGDLPISPPAWGWPEWQNKWQSAVEDFPTRVGMARGLPQTAPSTP